jgi:hypothetical protein
MVLLSIGAFVVSIRSTIVNIEMIISEGSSSTC